MVFTVKTVDGSDNTFLFLGQLFVKLDILNQLLSVVDLWVGFYISDKPKNK